MKIEEGIPTLLKKETLIALWHEMIISLHIPGHSLSALGFFLELLYCIDYSEGKASSRCLHLIFLDVCNFQQSVMFTTLLIILRNMEL